MFQHFQLLVFQKSVTAGVHVYVVMLISPFSPHRRVKIPAPLGGKLAFNTLTECFKWSEPNTFSFVGCRIRNIEPWREITGPKKGHYMHSPKFYGNIRERYFYFFILSNSLFKAQCQRPNPHKPFLSKPDKMLLWEYMGLSLYNYDWYLESSRIFGHE